MSEGTYSKHIFACVYIYLDNGIYFPEKNWDDFVLIIFAWWSDSIINLLNGSTHEDFCFMDGNFHFKINVFNERLFTINFYHNNLELQSFVLNKSTFYSEMKRNMNILLRHINILDLKKSNDAIKIMENFRYISSRVNSM
ncbi:hypothetical protein [Ornithobacterium rhinotracheale]|uniref:hypothetical protein n=1 Tax=Ornithobacterium rhinotracheale TaxID=28251 RepID=UPI001FF55EEB|nr:hypothetical protein [Ornithobacterium rhinotracheale]MCK0206368.1 hypothetical protein [Ornithobacterium rhinotracheale]